MNRKCPICDSDNKVKLYEIAFDFDDDFPLPKRNDIVCCRECGFAFADNDANQDVYDIYYKKFNVYTKADTIKYTNVNKCYVATFADVLKRYIDDKSVSIIDVGCGDGGLLTNLKDAGFVNLYGLDPAESSIAHLKEIGIKGFQGSIFDVLEIDNKMRFDYVISTGVAEHIYNLGEYIEKLSAFMKEDGALYIVVPDVEGFGAKYMSLPNYFNQEHINYFSRISLDNLLALHNMVNTSESRTFFDINGERILYGIYKNNHAPVVRNHDTLSKKSIESFLNKYKRNGNNANELREFLNGREFIIWGTGSLANQLLAQNNDLKKGLKYCVDNNPGKIGTRFAGYPVESPEVIRKDSTCPIVICSMMNHEDIVEQINSMGLSNQFIVCY